MSEIVAAQHIDSKLKFFYLKSFRWLLHALYWVYVYVYGQIKQDEPIFFLKGFLLNFLFDNWLIICFYYIYALVLIPRYFKKNRFKEFWFWMLITFTVFPILDISFQYCFQQFILVKYADYDFVNRSFLSNLFFFYRIYLFNFVSFLAFLFLIETAEGIDNAKESLIADNEIQHHQLQLLKTKIKPGFIMETLNAIELSAIANDTGTSQSILRFSDVLRYRLYRVQKDEVLLDAELEAIHNLFALHNLLYDAKHIMDIYGDATQKVVPATSLIEIFIKMFEISRSSQIVFYILAESEVVNIALEWAYGASDLESLMETIQEQLIGFYGKSVSFTYEHQPSHCSIRIDLHLINN